MRNLDSASGHNNGETYIVTELNDRIIEAVVAGGAFKGQRLFIPRIPLKPTDGTFPFDLVSTLISFCFKIEIIDVLNLIIITIDSMNIFKPAYHPQTRKQFPVRPCFGRTSNKSQGQTLKKVGIYLDRPFFSHGQYYVAQSRVGSASKLKILVGDGSGLTDNVVYPEVLDI